MEEKLAHLTPLLDASAAATQTLVDQMRQALETSARDQRAREFNSPEFQAAFRARLEEDLPLSQAFQDLAARLRSNAMQSRDLQAKFDQKTDQLRAEFISTRGEFGQRLTVVEEQQQLLAQFSAPFAPSSHFSYATAC